MTAEKTFQKLSKDELNGLDDREYRDYCRAQLVEARKVQSAKTGPDFAGIMVTLMLFAGIVAVFAVHLGVIAIPKP